jgi:hypothetical protein
VIVAVYDVLYARDALGVNVAIDVPVLNVTNPEIAALPGPVSVNVDAVIVDEFIGTLNVAVSALATFTPVAPLDGVVVVTVGTGAAAVVKLHV